VASAGLHTAVLRWVPEYEAQARPDDGRRALRWAFGLTTASAIMLMGSAAIVVAALSGVAEKAFIFAGICLVLPMVVAELLASALRAKGSVIWAQLPRDVLWRLAGIGLAVFAIVRAQPSSAAAALMWLAILLAIVIVPQVAMIWHELAAKEGALWPDKALARNWAAQLWSYWGIAVIYASTQYVDVLLVGTFLSSQDAGAYFAASRTASLCALMLVASNMVSAPLISGAFHAGDMVKLQRILRVISVCISVPTIFIAAGLVIGGKPLLSLFDPGFVFAYPALVVLALAHGLNGICGPMSYVLQLTGHARMNLIIIAGSYAVGIVLQIVLMPIYGVTGAAIGSGGAIVMWNIISWVYCRSQLKVDPTLIALFTVPRRESHLS
jgi:O-antigen/teichoic acid export membrane protein